MKGSVLVVGVILVCWTADIGDGRAVASSHHADGTVRGFTEALSHSHLGDSPLGDWPQAAIQPLLEEFAIDSSVFYVAACYDQKESSIAFDGTNYLVVWVDDRLPGVTSDIFGARVDPSGAVLDPVGIAICTAGGDQISPSVAFDGINYVVAWEDHRRGIEPDTYGARVDASGIVLDPSGIEIHAVSGRNQTEPCIASDGTNSLVIWLDFAAMGRPDIWGARVNHAGTVIDPFGFPVTADTFIQACPSLAFGGANYLVVWEDSRGPETDVYGLRLSQSLVPLDSSIAICTAPYFQYMTSIAFGGTDYFVAWCDFGEHRVHGTRVDTSGLPLDPSGIVICTTSCMVNTYIPSVVFNGQDYLVGWTDCRSGTDLDVYGARVSTSGIPLDSSGFRISMAYGTDPCAASDGTNSLVAWQVGRGGFLDIRGARVSQSGTVLDTSGITISTAANQQLAPSAAYGSSDYLAVWGDDRNGDELDVYGARVDPSGTVLDPSGIVICRASGNQDQPSVAFGDPNYLVVWRDGRNGSDLHIYGTRIGQSGTVLDSSIVISSATQLPRIPAVACGGDNYLVVWTDYRAVSNVWGARVDTAGLVLDTSGIVISGGDNSHEHSAVASDGIDYFVVWTDDRNGSDDDIYGSRVTESGTVLDTSGIAISTVLGGQSHPSVAFDGTNYFVVWKDSRFVPYSDIYGARVDGSGVVLDPYPYEILVSTADGDQLNPSVSFDGNTYLVVWEDGRNGDGWDIYGARVDTSGVVLDTLGIELIDQVEDRANPVTASGTGGQFLLVYYGFVLESLYSNRAFGAFYPGVGVTEEGDRPKTLHVRLHQNRPNPFHSLTAIRFQVPGTTYVSLRVHDVSGRVVGTLVDEERTAGLHEILWDGKDSNGDGLPSGVYFCRLKAGEGALTKKMVLAR